MTIRATDTTGPGRAGRATRTARDEVDQEIRKDVAAMLVAIVGGVSTALTMAWLLLPERTDELGFLRAIATALVLWVGWAATRRLSRTLRLLDRWRLGQLRSAATTTFLFIADLPIAFSVSNRVFGTHVTIDKILALLGT